MEHNILLSLQFSACPTIYIHPPLPVICFITLDNGHSIFGTWEFLFNMIPSDHVNVFYEKGLHYHTINHTIIRVNGLIVTQNLYFLKELITALSFYRKKKVRRVLSLKLCVMLETGHFSALFHSNLKKCTTFCMYDYTYILYSPHVWVDWIQTTLWSNFLSCVSLWKEKATKRKEVWMGMDGGPYGNKMASAVI